MAGIDANTGITTESIAEKIRQKIIGGNWKEGQPTPTIRQLAETFNTSNQTIQNAMFIIESEGFIERQSRRPAIVISRSARNPVSYHRKNNIKQIGLLKLPDEKKYKKTISETVVGVDDWSLRILESLKHHLFKHGHEVVYLPFLGADEDSFSALVDRNLDGYVFMGRSRLQQLHHSLGKAGIPWVCFCGVGYEDEHNVIHAKNLAGGRKVGSLFVRLGYEKVLFIEGNFEHSVTGTQKITGAISEYIKNGLGISGLNVVASGGIDQLAGYEATSKYIQQFGPPDGIFATGDYLAQGACDACSEAGLAVGQDVGIIGATGLESSAYSRPPLTVLRQPMEEMGEGAAKMLVEMIKNGQTIVPSRGFESKLIVRQSLKIPDEVNADVEKDAF